MPPLDGWKILIVEDEYLIADDLDGLLQEAGASVVGPARTLPQAMQMAGDGARFDAALLDVDIDGVAVFSLVDELQARGVPILFLSACDRANLPQEYRDTPLCEKPASGAQILDALKSIRNDQSPD